MESSYIVVKLFLTNAYYIIQIALAPDVEILYTLTDSNNDRLRDSDNVQLVTE